jgi:hypothetical protein
LAGNIFAVPVSIVFLYASQGEARLGKTSTHQSIATGIHYRLPADTLTPHGGGALQLYAFFRQ